MTDHNDATETVRLLVDAGCPLPGAVNVAATIHGVSAWGLARYFGVGVD